MTATNITQMAFGEVCRLIAMAHSPATPAIKATLSAVLSASSLQSALVVARKIGETDSDNADMEILSSSIIAMANSLIQCADRLNQTVITSTDEMSSDALEACLQSIRIMADLTDKADGIVGLHNPYASVAAADCAGSLVRAADTVGDTAEMLIPRIADSQAAESAGKEIDMLLNRISATCSTTYKAVNTIENP